MLLRWRIAKRVFARFAEIVLDAKWIVVSCALAAASLLSLVFDIALPDWSQWLLLAGAVTLITVDLIRHRGERQKVVFTDRWSEDFSAVTGRFESNPRFRVLTSDNDAFIADCGATEAISAGRVAVSLSGKYVPASHFAGFGRQFRIQTLRGEKWAYDGPVVSLDTSFGPDHAPFSVSHVVTRRSTYWHYLASDVFARHDVELDGRRLDGLGRSLFIRADGGLRDFRSSWLQNTIGVSVLAITPDGKMVVIWQTNDNYEGRGQCVPSGSGSLEPRDFPRRVDSPDFGEVLARGALREAEEEGGLPAPGDLSTTTLLGFGRWMKHAAKPEAVLLYNTDLPSDELDRIPRPKADRAFTRDRRTVRFSVPVDEWSAERYTDLVPLAVRNHLTMPLRVGLWLLAFRRDDSDPVIREAIARIRAHETLHRSGHPA